MMNILFFSLVKYFRHISFVLILIFPTFGNAFPTTLKMPNIDNSYVNQYLFPGESIIDMKGLEYNSNQIQLFLISTNPNKPNNFEGVLFDYDLSDWNKKQISAILAFNSSQELITDENLLREIFQSQVGGYLLDSDYFVYSFVPADDEIIDEFKNKSKELVFVTAFFRQMGMSLIKMQNQTDEYAEALRAILSTPNKIFVDFSNDVAKKAKQGLSWKSAIDEVIKMEKYANNKQIREKAKEAEKVFINAWDEAISPTNFQIDGYKVSFANWLDLGNLYMNLVFLDEFSKEKIVIFEDLAKQARNGNITLSDDLINAIDIVSTESKNSNFARENIIIDFVVEHSAELVVDMSEQMFRDLIKDLIWKEYGTRYLGHILAGASSSVFLAFSISDILFDTDSIYENITIAENAAKITDEINKNLKRIKGQNNQAGMLYPRNSNTYRELIIGWNLSMSQCYASYATAIKNSRLLKEIAAINLFGGNEWDDAIREFMEYAETGNYNTNELLINSEIIEYAITLPAKRVRNISPIIGNVDSSTVMVLDTSGSMVEEDITGLSKLDAAKHAAGNIINIISSEAQQNNAVTTRLGLVNYNDYAVVNLGLTTDYASVQSELNNLWTTGGTGMAAGLQAGLDLFGTSNVNEKQMIILLSDGIANIPIDPALSYDIDGIKQEVIDLSSRAGSQGVCVYTVGFGVPGSYGTIDEQFLTDIASASGCGAYYNAQDSIQLANVFVELRHTSMGNLVFDQTGQIAQGEELDLGTVAIPTNQELALFTLNWPGSKLELNIQDPTGTAVDENYPGATFSLSPSIVSVVLSNPMPGDWRLGILGVDIPQGITTYNSVVSTRMGIATPLPPATPTQQAVTIPSGSGGTGMIIFLLVTASVAAMLFIYVQTKNRTKKAAFNSQLVGVSGLYAGRTIVVRDHFTIGRGAGSNLVLNDPKVSRKHVQLRFANDAWFIQDMESSAGTFVNGRRVNGQRLSNGDQIQIGNQAFTFRVGG